MSNLKNAVVEQAGTLQQFVDELPAATKPAPATVFKGPGAEQHWDNFDNAPPWSGEWSNTFNDSFGNKVTP